MTTSPVDPGSDVQIQGAPNTAASPPLDSAQGRMPDPSRTFMDEQMFLTEQEIRDKGWAIDLPYEGSSSDPKKIIYADSDDEGHQVPEWLLSDWDLNPPDGLVDGSYAANRLRVSGDGDGADQGKEEDDVEGN